MIDRHSSYKPSDSMRDILEDNNLLLFAVSRFGIPFGFGDASVGDVCRRNGVDCDTFLAVINLLGGREHAQYRVSLPSLIAYLRNTHNHYLSAAVPALRQKLISAVHTEGSNDVSLLIIRMFDDYVAELRAHLTEENTRIFPYVISLTEGNPCGDFRIRDYEADHTPVTEKLQDLKDIFIYHYPGGNPAELSSVLFDIVTLEKDLMSHFEIENHLLVPGAEAAEMRHTDKGKEERQPTGLSSLGNREVEILRHIALGMSNKEIAERLFLSAHTVATHRKNIIAKLQIHSASGLTIFAILNGIVDLKDVTPR